MARPPVCKLMDYGKFKYESAQKARESRRNQAAHRHQGDEAPPEDRPHDYETKKGHVERFLKGGDKVKVTIMFRGREQSRPELGFRLLQRLAERRRRAGRRRGGPEAGRPQHDHGDRSATEARPAPARRAAAAAAEGAAAARAARSRCSRPAAGTESPDERRATGSRTEHRTSSCWRRRTRALPHGEQDEHMPKNKTHRGPRSASSHRHGKLVAQQTQQRSTSSSSSPAAVTRRLTGTVEIAPADAKRVKKLLGL